MQHEEAYSLIVQPTKNKARLALLLNDMILHDFESLVQLLYRVDVPENRLKQLLQQPHTDAGLLLANLLIERQEQKMALRKQFSTLR